MKPSMNLIAAACLLLMIVMATEMGPVRVVEARTCESLSQRFKGTCLSETNCGNVCKTEGFHAGDCRGLRRRCFCVKNC